MLQERHVPADFREKRAGGNVRLCDDLFQRHSRIYESVGRKHTSASRRSAKRSLHVLRLDYRKFRRLQGEAFIAFNCVTDKR